MTTPLLYAFFLRMTVMRNTKNYTHARSALFETFALIAWMYYTSIFHTYVYIYSIYKCLLIKLKKKEIIQSLKKFVKISKKCFTLICFIIRKKNTLFIIIIKLIFYDSFYLRYYNHNCGLWTRCETGPHNDG